ncbi:SGT1-domain-containing protein [Backusella circina FSU 941]|nr:SGT1-domain-containing protein [Backusella circina FSU 941]
MIQSFIQPLVKDYLWQKDDFHLSIVKDANNDPNYPFLYGATRFGDCINDEWFIIYLLFQISLHIPESVITLSDNDGDVLLIEAALQLPSWLDPSNSENRVYIHRGQVHLIPLPSSPADILQFQSTGRLLRQQAIRIIHSAGRNNTTLAETDIQHVIQERIDGYPDAAREEVHHALCLLPKRAAFVLHSCPQLLPHAIEAFYLRDPFSLKACSTMTTFPPIQSVETMARFTKTTFAQTVSQKFYAPKAFRLPSVSQKNKFRQAELGMKVACGLEMLYYNSKRQFPDTKDDDYPFETDKKFAAYMDHLASLGYFKDERKGSKLYQQLEQQAKSHYLESKVEGIDGEIKKVDFEDVDLSGDTRVPPHHIIDRLLKRYSEEGLDALLLEQQKRGIQPDSEDWMNVDPKQLEEMLTKRMGGHEDMMKDVAKDFSGDGMDLEKIMSSLEDFVENKESGVDGVEFPGEEEEEEEESQDDDDEEEGDIKFNIDEFMRILTGTLGNGNTNQEEEEEEEEEKLADVMEEMDQEIAGHAKMTGSFEKQTQYDEDENAPVDVQLNLVKNVLESFKSQQGLPGPVGNILSQFGVVLPGDNEEDDQDV